MRYHQLTVRGERRLAVADGSETYDLTSAASKLRTFGDLVRAADIADQSPDEIATRHIDDAATLDEAEIAQQQTVPVDADEVWAAGVTYRISEEAREEESEEPEIYLNVYDADRPEIFFKATPSRTVGPGDEVGIREDSEWDVPEPELGVVLYEGEIVGYTIGNDMSSRSIEGQNPLYLPQAKVYDRCCSLGPCIATGETVGNPHELTMSMSITRDGKELYNDETSTGEMVRSCEELVSYYNRHNAVPELAVLLTGTSLVPEDDFTLQEGDSITIDIENIGTLTNDVTPV
ncbi:MAG: fumarylacetoacetate hydrolase family protein [Haloarculaceae archaeon]